MQEDADKPRRRSSPWLRVLGLVALVGLVLASGFVAFERFQGLMLSRSQDELTAISILKAERISEWHAELEADAALLARDPLLARHVREWLQDDGALKPGSRTEVEDRLRVIQQSRKFDSVLLLDKDLRVRHAIGKSKNLEPAASAMAAEALRTNSIMRSDLHWSDVGVGREAEIDIMVPLSASAQDKSPASVIYLRIDPLKFLFPYIQSWPGQSASAESMLVRRDGEQVLFLNVLRHRAGAPLELRMPLSQSNMIAARAAQGARGPMDGTDYRGVASIGAAQAIAGTPWVLISKLDRAEVLAHWRGLALQLAGLAALLALMGGWIVTKRWQQRVNQARDAHARERSAIMDRIPAWFACVDSNRRYEFHSAAYRQSMGRSASEIDGHAVREVLGEDAYATIEPVMDRALAGETLTYDREHTTSAGERRKLTFNVVPRRSANGQITGYYAMGIDITERALAEDERERLAQVVRRTREAVIITDLDSKIVYVNPAFERVTGYGKDEALGTPTGQLLRSGKTEAQHYVAMWQALKSGKSWSGRFINRRKSGELYPDEVTVFPISGTDGALAGYASVQHDVTVAEQHLRQIGNLQRLYATLSAVNNTIVRAHSRDSLFGEIVRIAVDTGGYDLAAVNLLNPATNCLELHASYGPAEAYIRARAIDLDEDEMQEGTARRAITSGKVATTEDVTTDPRTRRWRAAGLEHGVRGTAQLPLTENGQLVGVLGLYRRRVEAFDVAEVKLLEEMASDISFALDMIRREALRAEAETQLRKMSHAIEQGASVVMITDRNGLIEYVNRSFTEVTGYTAKEAVGCTPRILKSVETPATLYEDLWQTIGLGGNWRGEFHNRKKNGEPYWCLQTVSPIRDEAGEITHYVGVAEDLSAHKRAGEMIERLAYYDALTGLANRQLLVERLLQATKTSKRGTSAVGVLHLNLDRFRIINETLGRSAGDELLQQAAERILKVVREGDTVARLGGDEFCIVLDSLGNTAQASKVAAHLLRAFERNFSVAGQDLFCTPSIGIATFPTDGDNAEVLLKNANLAMLRAKQRGNSFSFFAGAAEDASRERLLIEQRMRPAIEKGEFVAHFQPQINLATGKIIGFEALARWMDPERGMISPAHFIPLAEESGLIVPLGYRILEIACRQGAALIGSERSPIVIAVNLSARQFAEEDLAKVVLRVLAQANLDPSRLELEITESVVMGNIEEAITKMRELKDIGVQISVDDFGTGFSSLQYLKRFPIDKLKVDQSFVRNLLSSSEDQAICQSVIGLGQALGLRVIAEGVETEEQADWLRQHGCDEAQGYLFARPAPTNEIESILKRYGQL